MRSRRAGRSAALAIAVVLTIVAVGAVVSAPREYPVTAFLLAPLAAATVCGRRVTAAVAAAAGVGAALVLVAGDRYEGGALWFRLAFLAAGSVAIVALAAGRERRAAELERQQAVLRARSERRYGSLVEATSAIVWTTAPDGRFLDSQLGWEAFTGQAWPEYRDHRWIEAIHPDDRDRFASEWIGAFVAMKAHECECRLRHAPTGVYRHVVVRGVPLLEHDALQAWIGTVIDVHDRTEAVLRAASDAQLRTAVFESLQDVVFVTTATGRIIDVNDAWHRVFGMTREEAIGAEPPYPWWPDPATHPEEALALPALADLLARDADSGEYELTYRHTDGHHFPALTSISVIRDREGVRLVVGTVKDMTRHAEVEARLRTLASLTARLASADDVEGVGRAALDELVPLLGAGPGCAYLLEPEDSALRTVARLGTTNSSDWDRIPLDLRSPMVDALRASELLVITEQQELCTSYPGLADFVRHLDLHTTVTVPLAKGLVPVGALLIAFHHERRLGDDERHFLATVAPIIAQALDRARLFEFQRSVASTLQRAMMSSQPVAPVELAVAARYVPADAELAVGGDWYDVVPLDDERVAIAVGDIVGRGVTAAAVMGQLRSALSALARTTDSPVDAVAHLDGFAQRIEGARATTLVYGIVDHAMGTLRYTSAGHPPALLVEADGSTRFLEQARGWPLAVTDPARCRPEAIEVLPPASTLVLYTDGLVERRTEHLDRGLERLVAAASARATLPVERLCDELLDELVGDGHADDVALVALRMSSVRSPSFTCRVRAEPEALSSVRRALRAWLVAQELAAPLREDMLLAAGEACTNAVEHAYPPDARATMVIEGHRGPEQLVVTVRDDGNWRPLVPDPRRNRGLRLIAEVTDGFEITRARGGGTCLEMRRAIP